MRTVDDPDVVSKGVHAGYHVTHDGFPLCCQASGSFMKRLIITVQSVIIIIDSLWRVKGEPASPSSSGKQETPRFFPFVGVVFECPTPSHDTAFLRGWIIMDHFGLSS